VIFKRPPHSPSFFLLSSPADLSLAFDACSSYIKNIEFKREEFLNERETNFCFDADSDPNFCFDVDSDPNFRCDVDSDPNFYFDADSDLNFYFIF